MKIVDVEIDDIQDFRTLIEILNGFVSEANADFIKDIDVYTNNGKVDDNKNSDSDKKVSNNKKSTSTCDKKMNNKKELSKTNKKKVPATRQTIKNTDEYENDDAEDDMISGDMNDEEKLTYEEDTTESKKRKQKDNPGQLKILTTDSNQVLISFIALSAVDFKKFEVLPDEYRVGLNIDELFKYIKNVDKDGIMKISIDSEDSQMIVFNVESHKTSKISKCELKVLNLKDRKKKQIEADFTMAVRLSSTEFHKACKDLAQFSTHAEIVCDPDQLDIICKGDMSNHSRLFNNDGSEYGAVIKCMRPKGGDDVKPNIVRLIFELKYINMMYKCLNLCSDMEIYLKAGNVMFLKYGIGLKSTMLVGIAPSPTKDKLVMMHDTDGYDNEDIDLL